MLRNNFGVLILTHGRPDKVLTYQILRKHGYTGPIYLVVDDKDKTLSEYRDIYGKEVVVFSKTDYEGKFDIMDNVGDDRCVVYARNASFDIARSLGLDYFVMLDDDYGVFYFTLDDQLEYKNKIIHDLDYVFDLFVDYLKDTPLYSIAFAQGGDFIGGADGSHLKKIKPLRKCMNSFICATDRPYQFPGRINEDTNMYVIEGSRGKLFFTIVQIRLNQKETQSNSGGLTDIYLNLGTYVKSFYTVMLHPSSVKVSLMGTAEARLHHSISWEHTVPQIIREEHKKTQ